ncbi:MAG: putative metal-binding motif-containing protein [Alphaproteobacteria bacterium]|nr:putative metal-binding motif-containing protein [Alphaproteobacteria bacterium]
MRVPAPHVPALALALAGCGGLTGEPHAVLAEVTPLEVTIPVSTYAAPPRFTSFQIRNDGLSKLYITAAADRAEGDGADLLVFRQAQRTLAPYTPVSPNQTFPMEVTLDPRTWRWATGDYEVTFPFETLYFWQGQAVDEPDPRRTDVEPVPTAELQELLVRFSIDCDLDDDGYDATQCGGLDCNDQDAKANPDTPETCNGRDDDCDGTADEAAIDAKDFYEDRDGDGYGDPERKVVACAAPAAGAWVTDRSTGDKPGLDCDDSDGQVNPERIEGFQPSDAACKDLRDNDCDGKVDLADPGCTP